MYTKCFVFTLLILFILVLIVVYHGHTGDFPTPDDSVHADTHCNAFLRGNFPGSHVHSHAFGFAHSDRDGNYTLIAKVSEAPGADWNREASPPDDIQINTFHDGLEETANVKFDAPNLNDLRDVVCKASATVNDTTTDATATDYSGFCEICGGDKGCSNCQ
ncbi:MAG: hypothetical protein OXU23_28170 [Candidatus Poribacteria bacterium]|nr:hypothetical protein [Candidatus Poribacteria bacterium]